MLIRQRQLFTATVFDFCPEGLKYTFKTPRGAKQLAIDYADISMTSRRIEQRHDIYLYVGLVLVAVGALLGAYIYTSGQGSAGFGYALWGVLFVIAYFVQRSTFLVFSVGGDPLIALADRQAPAIAALIDRHRKARFIELLRSPDLSADAAKKQEFVAWLIERGALTPAEIAAAADANGA